MTLELLSAPREIAEASDARQSLSAEIEKIVDEVWLAEKEKRPGLFDGQIFTIEDLNPQRAIGRFVPYRYFIAQLSRPELFEFLRLQALAVTGVLSCPDGIVFGHRDKSLTQQGGCWELVPAGGIDRHSLEGQGRLDVTKQLMVELEEEVGLSRSEITSTEVCCLIRDRGHHVLDIVIKIGTCRSASEILSFHRALKTPEHLQLRVVAAEALSQFATEAGQEFLPASAVVLRGLGLLPPAGFSNTWRQDPPVLLLRTDASVEIGTGHLMRSLALAQAWQRSGGKVVHFGNIVEPMKKRLIAEKIETVPLQSNAGSPEDAAEAVALAFRHHAAWVVLDGYQFGTNFQKQIRKGHWRVSVIDDCGGAPRYDADLIINQNSYAVENLYPRSATSARLLLGCEYALLREEFSRVNPPRRSFQGSARHLLITLGGSDPMNLTEKAFDLLPAMDARMRVKAIIGAANPRQEKLKQMASKLGIEVVINPGDMAELMAWADIAISAGGSTCWELLYMGVPTLLVIVAENQRANVESLAVAGVVKNLGWHENWETERNASILSALVDDAVGRRSMSEKGAEMVDGCGADRVVDLLRENAITVRPATAADVRLLFDWANEPGVREASFQTKPIGWEEHISWFQGKLNDITCRIYVTENLKGVPVGMIRFDEQMDADLIVSISVDSRQRGRGIGGRMLDLAMRITERQRPVAKYIALVKPTNHDSRQLFEKHGYHFVKVVNYGETEAIEYHRHPTQQW